jgi:hypothetical protein
MDRGLRPHGQRPKRADPTEEDASVQAWLMSEPFGRADRPTIITERLLVDAENRLQGYD